MLSGNAVAIGGHESKRESKCDPCGGYEGSDPSATGGSVTSGDANANGGSATANGGDWATAVAIDKGSNGGGDPWAMRKDDPKSSEPGSNTANAGNGGDADGGDGGFANSGNLVVLSGNAGSLGGDARGGDVTSGDANANGGSATASGGDWATAVAVSETKQQGGPSDPCGGPCSKDSKSYESGGGNTANAGNGGDADGGDGGFANSGNAVLLSGNALAFGGHESKRGPECPPPCPPTAGPSATGGSVSSGDANANGGDATANGGNGATAIAVAESRPSNECPPPPCEPNPCPPPPCEPEPCPPPPCNGGGV